MTAGSGGPNDPRNPYQGYPQYPQYPQQQPVAAKRRPRDDDDDEFDEGGPAEGAEKMFADDPEMLALIKQARASKGKSPRRKPWWWQLLLGVCGVGWAAAASAPTLLLDVGLEFHPLQPAAGLLGGMLLALGILGHLPGRYRITDGSGDTVQESATLWKPIGAGLRALFCLAFLALPAVAYGLAALS